mgnify:CR=1 FL=1
MINKIAELAKSNPKISDFHLRGGTNIAYREMGDIIIDKNSKVESKDIEELLKTIRRDRPTVGDTEVELGSGDILRIQHYRDEGKEYKDGECFLLLKITMSCFVAMG